MQWLPQTLFLGLIFLLAGWVQAPAPALCGFGLAAVALIGAMLPRLRCRSWFEATALAAQWLAALVIGAALLFSQIAWDTYYAALAGLMAGAVWTASWRAPGVWKPRWDALVTAWLLAGAGMWLGAGYFQNEAGVFYAGLAGTAAVLLLLRLWFRWGAVGVQAINTLILLLVALPLVDWAVGERSGNVVRPDNCRLYYSFDAAKGDPESFARWEKFYMTQFDRLGGAVFEPAPGTRHPFRLRPGSQGMMMNCPVSINHLGLRGPEISLQKNGAYRIVALGESTTFGMTLEPADKPWPELLEQIIRTRLKPARPVQVINAGVPAYSIEDNLSRLTNEILPLQPDMIISYHGVNGFFLIDRTAIPTSGPVPPVFRERPVKLAAEVEHRLRLLFFQYQARHAPASRPSPAGHPLASGYAGDYRKLIQFARANQIRLALANFSMAVNADSNPKVVDFYRGGGSRAALGYLRANAVHSLILRQLAAQSPDVCFVDTHPHLDGDHEKFIDVVHFTGAGGRQLATNMFDGIRAVLERDLLRP